MTKKIVSSSLAIAILLLLVSNAVFATTIFNDDFNTYITGDLNGQGLWSGSTAFDVEETTVKEGAKAVEVSPLSGYAISKSGTAQEAGTQGVYARSSSAAIASPNFSLYLKEGSTNICALIAYNEGQIARYNAGGMTNLQAFEADTWYWLEIEWHTTPSKQCRFKIGETGVWTDWYSPIENWVATGPDKVQFYSDYAGNVYTAYYDYVSENPYSEVPPATTTPAYDSTLTQAVIDLTGSVNFWAGVVVFFLCLIVFTI